MTKLKQVLTYQSTKASVAFSSHKSTFPDLQQIFGKDIRAVTLLDVLTIRRAQQMLNRGQFLQEKKQISFSKIFTCTHHVGRVLKWKSGN